MLDKDGLSFSNSLTVQRIQINFAHNLVCWKERKCSSRPQESFSQLTTMRNLDLYPKWYQSNKKPLCTICASPRFASFCNQSPFGWKQKKEKKTGTSSACRKWRDLTEDGPSWNWFLINPEGDLGQDYGHNTGNVSLDQEKAHFPLQMEVDGHDDVFTWESETPETLVFLLVANQQIIESVEAQMVINTLIVT